MDMLNARLAVLKEGFAQAGFTITAEKPINYGWQVKVSDGQATVTVNIYNGKKGISIVVGGSGSPLKTAVEAICAGKTPAAGGGAGKAQLIAGRPPGFEAVVDFDNKWIGLDESGKGDFFGPLVVAAVLVDEQTADKLAAVGVKDSKALSDEKNRALAERIREECAHRFVELAWMPAEYNAMYSKFNSAGRNLNHFLAFSHARALESLLTQEPAKFAIADQFAHERFIQAELLEKGQEITLIQMHRAERNIAVAAASILARDRFLVSMAELSAQFGISFPKGAVQVVGVAREFAGKYGKAALNQVCKLHFKTFEQI
ncbi:ribonuclease HIII [Sporomusa sphaeroides]|uniref:Ribonuclease n=2 Tax=Sporomusa TaxID=2375 RepID=A0ABP2C330_9FIRM|nr:ribonuclease HIII [Sporomusa sphaeroides]OLS58029.1 ribonuclease HIII [Sporomusa sphaeroides DSM 2875]CVK17784.1 Ribonuclease HIII [Sporomusa sphaeroides DSM 2875]SCM80593.1 Ribonuclease [uncultured Sporomusa sp.]